MFFLINKKEGDILNTQDVTRSVIRLELARAFRGMESNPKRTLRKLADLGKVCARGSVQKEIFGIFQQCLRYKDSPYFSVMQNLVRNVSAENLTTFGMNLGYNSWTDGAKKIRAKRDNEGILTSWIQILDLSQNEWTAENLNAFIDFLENIWCLHLCFPSICLLFREHVSAGGISKSRMTVHSYGFFRMWILSVSIWMIIKMCRM